MNLKLSGVGAEPKKIAVLIGLSVILIGLMLGIFLFIAVCLIAMYGFLTLMKAMPK